MKKVHSGGGWSAIAYSYRKARESGGVLKFWRALRTKNTCKTCALGMGGQKGGMVNELGHFPEICKKGMQAMAADMQDGIPRNFWSDNTVSELRKLSPRELDSMGRLVEPLLYERNTDKYKRIEWKKAFDLISEKLVKSEADQSFWYFSGRSSNEAGFLLQLFARLYGTNNVNNCSYYCHQASGVALSSVIGSGSATIVLEDLEQADLVFVIGANPASNHPRLMSSLAQIRRKGGKVIVVNPIRETGLVRFKIPSRVRSLLFGSEIASLYIQPNIGGDLAFLSGVSKRIVELGGHDVQFLKNHCSGSDELLSHLESLSWNEIVEQSGVSAEDIDAVANEYMKAKQVVFSWAMGITHHRRGTENVQAIANLALLRGMIGKEGCGLMPIRGHSNVQGVGSVGVTPQLKQAIFDRLEKDYELTLPRIAGLDTMACIEGAAAGDLRIGFCLGGNLFGSNPDASFASRSLSNLDLLVYVSTKLNTGHAWGLAKQTIILPTLVRDEEPEPTTQESMFNYVRMSDGGPARHLGPRSEIDIIATLAERVLGNSTPINWTEMRRTRNIRDVIGRVVPGFEAMTSIDDSKEEFQIGGRTFHTPSFNTEDGRATLHTHSLVSNPGLAKNELRLMTIRSEGQFNTVVYEDYDLYRGVDRRDVILIHPADLRDLGIHDGDRIAVRGPAGTMKNIRATAFKSIKPTNAAMYFPESNQILDRGVDASSRTPAFKGAHIFIETDRAI